MIANRIGINVQNAGRIPHPTAIEYLNVNLFFNAWPTSVVRVGGLKAFAATITVPTWHTFATGAVLAQMLATAMRAVKGLSMKHRKVFLQKYDVTLLIHYPILRAYCS